MHRGVSGVTFWRLRPICWDMAEQSSTVLPEEVIVGIQQLEPLPITAQRILELMNGKDVAPAAIAELVEFDPAITAAVLRKTSTARYLGRGASSVREAVLRLGTIAMLDLVLEGYLKRLRTATPMYDLSEHDLWLHGAAAQLAVRALAAERPKAGIPAIAETAALLHDIGKLIMSRHLRADARELMETAKTRGITFVEAERELLGVDHAAVGAAMAQAWKFPPEIVDAIGRHHSPPFTHPTAVLDAVAVGNAVAKTIGAGLGAEGLNLAMDNGCYQRLGIDFRAYGCVCLQTHAWLKEMTRSAA
jgi:putative nucleotidyltransferase with HDIG domain